MAASAVVAPAIVATAISALATLAATTIVIVVVPIVVVVVVTVAVETGARPAAAVARPAAVCTERCHLEHGKEGRRKHTANNPEQLPARGSCCKATRDVVEDPVHMYMPLDSCVKGLCAQFLISTRLVYEAGLSRSSVFSAQVTENNSVTFVLLGQDGREGREGLEGRGGPTGRARRSPRSAAEILRRLSLNP